jgi:hypothetical protein
LKRIVAGTITALVLATLLIAAVVRSAGDPGARTPEHRLEQMFQAMKEGDVSSFLRCFTGELRERLDRSASEQTAEKFSAYLKETAAPVKGRAVYKTEASGDDDVRLVVDRVYEQRPWEYQGYRLRRESGDWKIYAIDPAELHEPPIPYGTPAFSASGDDSPPADSPAVTR